MSSLAMPEMDDDYWLRAISRAWAKVEVKASGCWEWCGTLNRKGYGHFFCAGRTVMAHRFFYSLTSALTPGLEVDHTCSNRACVNPLHLREVSHLENVRCSANARKGCRNREKTHCPSGHHYSKENTRVRVNKHGHRSRYCKACDRETKRAKARASRQ